MMYCCGTRKPSDPNNFDRASFIMIYSGPRVGFPRRTSIHMKDTLNHTVLEPTAVVDVHTDLRVAFEHNTVTIVYLASIFHVPPLTALCGISSGSSQVAKVTVYWYPE